MKPRPRIARSIGKRWRPLACASLSAALLGGCATPSLTPVPPGERVSLRVSTAGSADDIRIHNLSVGTSASVGGATGLLGGAMWGLSCGPAAPLCVPLGLAAGALVGLGGGAAVGLTGVLEGEKATQLRARVRQALAAHGPQDGLRERIAERAQGPWQLASDAPAFVLNVQLQPIELTSTRNEEIGLVLKVLASASRGDASPSAALTERTLSCTPTPAPLALWLEETSQLLDSLFDHCNRQFATQIVAELARARQQQDPVGSR